MTVTAAQVTAGRTAPGSPSLTTPGPADPPRLADGVELLGEYRDSGYSRPPSLVRRPDGQVIQMSPLLYRVTSRIDGSRNAAAVADLVSADLGRTLTADQVRHLITAKLQPLGLLADQGSAAPPKARPLLALRARGTLLPEPAANAVALLLRPLFRWPVVAAVTVSFVGVDCWLFASHALGAGLEEILSNPIGLLAVFGLSVLSGAFHECGHATGCRYSGARPGVIGIGIYLVYPSFFTNVTDSYRLSRAGRLRTDLGGVYFNAVFILVLAGLYAATSALILLLVIAITQVEMLQQLIPVVRFDGYFILSDLAGVPDMFARVVPIVKSVLPGGLPGPAGRRPAARHPDPRDLVGPGRHPAAHRLHGIPAAAPARGQPRAVAFRQPAGPPHGYGRRRPPLRNGRGRRARRRPGELVTRRHAVHHDRPREAHGHARPDAGRQAVQRAASWPPRPGWRARPHSPPCGPFRADFTGGSQPPKIRSQARAAALPSSSGQNLAVNAWYAARCADATASMSAIADTTSSEVASSGPGASAAKSK